MNTPRSLLTAHQLMRRNVHTLSPDQDVVDAVQELLKKSISGAPVVHEGKVVGMFSERDCLAVLAAATYEQEPRGTVGHHMRADIRCVKPETDMFELTRLFRETLVRRLPVVDEHGHLLGLVLRSDLMVGLQEAWCARTQEPEITQPSHAWSKAQQQLADG